MNGKGLKSTIVHWQ